jgi:hypothetical protein
MDRKNSKSSTGSGSGSSSTSTSNSTPSVTTASTTTTVSKNGAYPVLVNVYDMVNKLKNKISLDLIFK